MDPREVQKSWGSIPDAIRSIGEGIGEAARAVVRSSETPIGTLAVKQADVTIEFELAATTTARYIEAAPGKPDPGRFEEMAGLGALAFRSMKVGATENTETARNHAAIKLTIVAVPPQKQSGLPTTWPWNRWSLDELEAATSSLDEMLSMVTDVPGGMHALVPMSHASVPRNWTFAKSRNRARVAIERLNARLVGSTQADRDANPDGALLESQLANLEGVLESKVPDADLVHAAGFIALVRAIANYLKGVLAHAT